MACLVEGVEIAAAAASSSSCWGWGRDAALRCCLEQAIQVNMISCLIGPELRAEELRTYNSFGWGCPVVNSKSKLAFGPSPPGVGGGI